MTLHEDPDMDAQLARTLIGTYVGGADLGEAIATAQRVQAGDYGGWHDEWDRTATAAQQTAEQAAQKGLLVLAGRGYLGPRNTAASRTSSFDMTLPTNGSPVRTASSETSFASPCRSCPGRLNPSRSPSIRCRSTATYFGPTAQTILPRPTVLFPGGFDGTCEEMFKYGAHGAMSLGWNAVTWDGPGQGGQLIEHGLTMRPDFEAVLSPVVDWVLEQPFVSADALALVG